MLIKKEKYRQSLFLILIIGCTIMIYTTWYFENVKRKDADIDLTKEKRSTEQIKNETATQELFSNFIKNPNSKEGVNSLFNAVVRWELHGKKDSVQYALKEFETIVKNKFLRNSFYNQLGQFYISSYKKKSLSSASIKKTNTTMKTINVFRYAAG
jgi:hypothetical protein